jgi:hypothetical protein
MGKKGATINEMRNKSSASIKLLSPANGVPIVPCALPDDEMISVSLRVLSLESLEFGLSLGVSMRASTPTLQHGACRRCALGAGGCFGLVAVAAFGMYSCQLTCHVAVTLLDTWGTVWEVGRRRDMRVVCCRACVCRSPAPLTRP